jgi:hypothetical protein
MTQLIWLKIVNSTTMLQENHSTITSHALILIVHKIKKEIEGKLNLYPVEYFLISVKNLIQLIILFWYINCSVMESEV